MDFLTRRKKVEKRPTEDVEMGDRKDKTSRSVHMTGVMEALWVAGDLEDDNEDNDYTMDEDKEEEMEEEDDDIGRDTITDIAGPSDDDFNDPDTLMSHALSAGFNRPETLRQSSQISKPDADTLNKNILECEEKIKEKERELREIEQNRKSDESSSDNSAEKRPLNQATEDEKTRDNVQSELEFLRHQWKMLQEELEKTMTPGIQDDEQELPIIPRSGISRQVPKRRGLTQEGSRSALPQDNQRRGLIQEERRSALPLDITTIGFDNRQSYQGGNDEGYPTRRYVTHHVEPEPSDFSDDVLNNAALFGQLARKKKSAFKEIISLKTELKKLTTENEKPIRKEYAGRSHLTPPAEDHKPKDLPDTGSPSEFKKDVEGKNDKDIERIKKEIPPLEEAARRTKSDLENIREFMERNPRVKMAKNDYRFSRRSFINHLFKGIEKGELRDVQAKVVVLDMKSPKEDHLPSITNRSGYPPLHVALLFNQLQIAAFLVEHSGDKLSSQPIYFGEEYDLTPLHLALYQGNWDIIKKIVDSVPSDQEKETYINKKIFIESYMSKPYGELPLAATAWSCMKHHKLDDIKAIMHYLVSKGADLDMKTEKEGNTLLHLIVLQALECLDAIDYFRAFLVDVFEPAAELWLKNSNLSHSGVARAKAIQHLMSIPNNDGLTPLVLAAKVESPLYEDLVNWNGVMCFPDPKGQKLTPKYFYNVSDIISIDQKGSYRDKSVMHVLAHSEIDLCRKTWKVDIIDTEPMRTLIKKKWHSYQWFFYGWGLFHILFMTLFTCLSLHDLSVNSPRKNASNTTQGNLTGTEAPDEKTMGNLYFLLFLTVPVLYFLFEIWDFSIMLKSLEMRFTITGNFMYRVISCLFTIFTVTWFFLQLAGNVNQDILLALSLLFGWIFCIFFTRTISFPSKDSQIGAFSIMVQRMLLHDLIPFLLISFFIMISFSTAMQATLSFMLPPDDANLSFRNTFYQMIKYFAALDDPMGETSSRNQEFAKVLLVIYGIIIVVLLINMLIAAMNKSYDVIRETRCNLVARQRLSILLMLERRLFCYRSVAQKNLFDYVKGKPYITIIHESAVTQLMKSRLPKKKTKIP